MEYLGQIIIFLSAIIAITGNTWNKNKKGIKKITITGYFTICLAFLGTIISIFIISNRNTEESINKGKIDTTLTTSLSSNLKLQKASNSIDSLNKHINNNNLYIDSLQRIVFNMDNQIKIYKEIITEIKVQSDRQDQTVLMEFVQLRPGGNWYSPIQVYSGSIIEFLGFEEDMELEYDGKRVLIPKWDGHAVQTAIMGESGRGYRIRLFNPSSKEIMGKVHGISSPRIRSKNWSWIDEKIKKIDTSKMHKSILKK